MASPQLENGYLRIANEIAEALARVNLSPYESRVLWFIFRETYGYQQKGDHIPLSQFAAGMGLDRRLAHRALKSLSSKKMTVIGRDDKNQPTIGFQKDYEKWEFPERRKVCVIGTDDKVSSAEIRSEDNIKKKDNGAAKAADPLFFMIEKVIRRLNELAGTAYRPNTKATCRHIKGRLSEGFTEADLLTVVEDRCGRWRGNLKMDQYLRPSTLFNSEKFEGYLQAARSRNDMNGSRSLHSPEFVG